MAAQNYDCAQQMRFAEAGVASEKFSNHVVLFSGLGDSSGFVLDISRFHGVGSANRTRAC